MKGEVKKGSANGEQTSVLALLSCDPADYVWVFIHESIWQGYALVLLLNIGYSAFLLWWGASRGELVFFTVWLLIGTWALLLLTHVSTATRHSLKRRDKSEGGS